MGSNNSKKSPNNLSTHNEYSNNQNNEAHYAESVHNLKRQKSNSNANINHRSSTSPVITDNKQRPINFEGFRNLDSNVPNKNQYNQNSNFNKINRNSHQNFSSNQNSSKSSFSNSNNTHQSIKSQRIIIPIQKQNSITFTDEPKRIQAAAPRPPIIHHHVQAAAKKNNESRIFNMNKQMRSNQQKLSNIIKQSDSNHTSYHLSSKLYKPNSLIAANQNLINSPSMYIYIYIFWKFKWTLTTLFYLVKKIFTFIKVLKGI